MSSHFKYTRKKKWCHLPSIFRQHLPKSNIVVPFIPTLYELATTKEWGLHFVLSDNGNYDFDVKAKCCRLVSFVKAVIGREYLGCVCCFIIKDKKQRHILYQPLFYYIPPKNLFIYLFLFT